ncbi:MAG: nucleoside phosphorylase [Proteobacteria bacterium]|nr:nucleoside phosphorylase [Pseudomonadota bacterium]
MAGERQYHIGTSPGEVADYILFCGDPDRAERTAAKFDRIELENRNREYVLITGLYKGERLTVCATGMGCDNTEIAMVELNQCVENPTFLRIGTCGALQPGMES